MNKPPQSNPALTQLGTLLFALVLWFLIRQNAAQPDSHPRPAETSAPLRVR
jgi:hypothetical protein